MIMLRSDSPKVNGIAIFSLFLEKQMEHSVVENLLIFLRYFLAANVRRSFDSGANWRFLYRYVSLSGLRYLLLLAHMAH